MNNADLPAFPEPFLNDPHLALSLKGGLTKREYFAAIAMQGLAVTWNQPNDHGHAAHLALMMTDELLKQLALTHSK